MENLLANTIVYSINIEDVQNVASQEIGRELNAIEVNNIIDTIAENIDWYNAIADAIRDKLTS